MLNLSELKISPTPWTNRLGNGHEWNSVWDAANGEVLSGGYVESVADARFIATAPKIYETEYVLVDVIERLLNGRCGTGDVPTQEEVVAALEASKKALAEAAGESEVK